MRSIGIAMAVSISAAVAAMLMPASVLESVTGASGLSELLPAASAPLGDTARALFAFGAGALTLALMALLLLRDSGGLQLAKAAHIPAAGMPKDDEEGFAASLMDRLSRLRMPKMPWDKSDDDITDLADLPRLRGGDIHPDAPARRPLRATQDLPVLEPVEKPLARIEPTAPETLHDNTADRALAVEADVTDPEPSDETQPSLAEMVAQLEASVAQREQQLAALEIVAANLSASKGATSALPVVEPPAATAEPEPPVEPQRSDWPPLEVVPVPTVVPDDMDEALASALATLHRMNGTGR